MIHAIKEISRHSSIYRGFLITRRHKTVISKIARYEVKLDEQSFGLFDAQAEATGFIDNLYKNSITTTYKKWGDTVITPPHQITPEQLNEWVELSKS